MPHRLLAIPSGPPSTVTSKKTAALSVADTKVLGRTTRCDATFDDVLYNLNPVDLFQSKHS
jgi:hypothetical protein